LRLSSPFCSQDFIRCGKGGDVAANWSNRLMRYRILAQIVAIAIILAVLYFSRR
jgi:hypothetical protein